MSYILSAPYEAPYERASYTLLSAISNVNLGTTHEFTVGAGQDLVEDADSAATSHASITLSSNRINLAEGTYLIKFSAFIRTSGNVTGEVSFNTRILNNSSVPVADFVEGESRSIFYVGTSMTPKSSIDATSYMEVGSSGAVLKLTAQVSKSGGSGASQWFAYGETATPPSTAGGKYTNVEIIKVA